MIDRKITLVLPGPVSFDGQVYRAFKPYALFANDLCRHFRQVAICTQVLGPNHAGFAGCDTEIRREVGVEPLPEPPEDAARGLGYQLRRALAVMRLVRGWDMIYVFIPSYPGAIAYTAARLAGRKDVPVYLANDWEEIAPHTYRGRGWRRRLMPSYRRLLTAWERWIMRTAPLALTAGRALHEKYGGEGRPVYETVPFLEMASYDMVRRDPASLQSPVRLLYIGSLIPRKGLPVLFDAIRELAETGLELRLDVVGSGEDAATLARLAREMDLSSRITFHGFVENGPALFEFYKQADLFVLPTYSEGFPRVLYEAMGHSVPVVASAVSGIPRLLRNEEHALLVPPGDREALAGAIRRTIEEADLRRRMVKNAFELVGPIISADPAEQFERLCRQHLDVTEAP